MLSFPALLETDMNRFIALACLLALTAILPACSSNGGVSKDQTAIDKDNAVLDKDTVALERDRVMKAQNKAAGNWGSQAVNSIGIGYDRLLIGEKNTEKSIDETIENQDTK